MDDVDTESIEIKQFELKLELSPTEKLLSLLTPNEIFERLDETIFGQLKEDRRVERKSASVTPRVLGDYFSMWANTCPDGGLIFIGVEDGGRVTGCQRLPQAQLNDLEDAGRQEGRRGRGADRASARVRSRALGVVRLPTDANNPLPTLRTRPTWA